jgi:hypothetical protein
MAASCVPATIEAADHRVLVLKWSAFPATAERGTYFATYRGTFVVANRYSTNAGDER